MDIKLLWTRIKSYVVLNICLLLFVLIMVRIKPIDTFRGDYLLNNRFDFGERIFLYGDSAITQEFTGIDGADTIELLVSCINNSLHGCFNVEVLDDSGKNIGKWTTYKMDVPSEGLITYRLDTPFSPGRIYYVRISAPELDQDTALMVSLGYADLKAPGIGDMTFEGSEQDLGYCRDKVMTLSLYRQYTNIFAYLAILIVFVISNLFLLIRDKGIKAYALPVLFAAGLVMLIIEAPGSNPDEKYHYYSSFVLADKLLGQFEYNGIDPEYAFDFYLKDGYVGFNANTSYIKTIEGLGKKTAGNNGERIYDVFKEPYVNPFSHIAPAIGIAVGRILKLNFVTIYELGRICNMIMYVMLAYIAIKLIPDNKELMLLMAMTPMMMQQCTGLSYDAVVNGLSLIFAACILKASYEEQQVGWKNMAICVGILGILAVVKVIYVCLGLMIFIITGKNIKKAIPILAAPAILLLLIKGKEIAAVGTQTGGLYTIGTIIREPIRFLRLILFTLENNGWLYLKEVVGNMFTGGFTSVSEWLTLAYIFIICLCILSNRETIVKSKRNRIIIYLTVIAGFMAVLLAFTVAYTPYGSLVVMAVQGRYFIPFVVPALYCMNGRRVYYIGDRSKLFIPVWFIELGYVICIMSQVYYDI